MSLICSSSRRSRSSQRTDGVGEQVDDVAGEETFERSEIGRGGVDPGSGCCGMERVDVRSQRCTEQTGEHVARSSGGETLVATIDEEDGRGSFRRPLEPV